MDRRLIGLKFCGNFEFLPGLGKAINLASFQDWKVRQLKAVVK
jgi:hypothetical protein